MKAKKKDARQWFEERIRSGEVSLFIPASSLEIRSLRKHLELSPLALAKVLGVHVSQLKAWESGAQEASGPATTLIRFLAHYPEEAEEIAAL